MSAVEHGGTDDEYPSHRHPFQPEPAECATGVGESYDEPEDDLAFFRGLIYALGLTAACVGASAILFFLTRP